MSNAKICDTCTMVFPEGQEGSMSGVGNFTRVIDGVTRNVQQATDKCGECVAGQQAMYNGGPVAGQKLIQPRDEEVKYMAQNEKERRLLRDYRSEQL